MTDNTATEIAAINEAGRLLDPDGWIDVTELASLPTWTGTPAAVHVLACCGRPHSEHPRTDPTTRGTCRVHTGIEVTMHWNGRSYACGLCATDAFHATI